MDNEFYAITNIEGYALEMRQAAADSLTEDCADNLDDYISIKQMINLVKSECVGFDDNGRPLLNEDANEQIYNSTVAWINNVGLAKLAAQDLVECAWDSELNEMVFWANKETNAANPENKTNDKSIKRRNKKKN
jgi:hypothetical protein